MDRWKNLNVQVEIPVSNDLEDSMMCVSFVSACFCESLTVDEENESEKKNNRWTFELYIIDITAYTVSEPIHDNYLSHVIDQLGIAVLTSKQWLLVFTSCGSCLCFSLVYSYLHKYLQYLLISVFFFIEL